MIIDFSAVRLLLVLGLLAGAVCFGFCLRAITSKAPRAEVNPNWHPPPVALPPTPLPGQHAQQWQPSAPQHVPAAAAPRVGVPSVDNDRGRERLMIGDLIGAYDTFEIEGVRIYVSQALKRAGVSKIEPAVGTPFDPGLHKSVGVVPAQSPDQHLHVAGTTRPGWLDSEGSEIRSPEVTVYKWEGPR